MCNCNYKTSKVCSNRKNLDNLCECFPSSLSLFIQAGVIMGEVNCIWPDIRRQVDDPFLVRKK